MSSSLHPHTKLINLRLFQWNDVATKKHEVVRHDEGLFAFNFTVNLKEKSSMYNDLSPKIINFKLCYLFKDNLLNLAKQIISKAYVFGPKTTKLLAQQVADYMMSCYRFRPLRRANARPRLVFVADLDVDSDGDEQLEEDAIKNHNEVVLNGLYCLVEPFIRVEQDNNNTNHGWLLQDVTVEEAQHEVYSHQVLERLVNSPIEPHPRLRFEPFIRPTRDAPLRLFIEPTCDGFRPRVLNIDVNYTFIEEQPCNEGGNIMCTCSDVEEVDDNNLEEFNHVLNILRVWIRVEDENNCSNKDGRRASKRAKKAVQDHTTLLKSLSKIKPTLVKLLAKEEELSEDSMCSICFEKTSSDEEIIKMIPCKHVFHGECLFNWLPKRHSCPNCRTSSLVNVYY